MSVAFIPVAMITVVIMTIPNAIYHAFFLKQLCYKGHFTQLLVSDRPQVTTRVKKKMSLPMFTSFSGIYHLLLFWVRDNSSRFVTFSLPSSPSSYPISTYASLAPVQKCKDKIRCQVCSRKRLSRRAISMVKSNGFSSKRYKLNSQQPHRGFKVLCNFSSRGSNSGDDLF